MARGISLVVLAAMLMLGACGGGDDDDGATGTGTGDGSTAELAGRQFVSTAVTGHELVPGTRIALSLDEDGNLSTSAGCNTLFGAYELDGDTLVVGRMGGTEMGCDPDRSAQDTWLAGFLTSSPTTALSGETLTLTAAGVSIELLDREVADPDRPLVGTRWDADSIIEGGGPDGAVSTLPAGTEAWLELTDGEVEGFDTCNSFSGPVEIGEGTMTFGTLTTTFAACDDAGLYAFLDGSVGYAVDAGRLTLTAGDGRGFSFTATG